MDPATEEQPIIEEQPTSVAAIVPTVTYYSFEGQDDYLLNCVIINRTNYTYLDIQPKGSDGMLYTSTGSNTKFLDTCSWQGTVMLFNSDDVAAFQAERAGVNVVTYSLLDNLVPSTEGSHGLQKWFDDNNITNVDLLNINGDVLGQEQAIVDSIDLSKTSVNVVVFNGSLRDNRLYFNLTYNGPQQMFVSKRNGFVPSVVYIRF